MSAKPAYRHVGENLYRRISSGTYYALLKKGGKQFRRSLKTNDVALARRRLNELREEISSLVSHDAGDLTFMIVADRWQASVRHRVKESTCIESGVDIPTVSKWLGHKDGGALAMKVYGHLRQEHSFAQIKRVQFGSETLVERNLPDQPAWALEGIPTFFEKF